ncbi:oxidoreductase [Cyanobium sp. Morenito 9A2]|uniref:oxidoreductase n=1 Tax=Cyanobium sp. Morenito 9A2 TaxID=2823718 RepID=UPI0020CF16D1|nr:oxidoreductase [Cyanobium sp. Morenito 9A2]MCP9850427.1 SDR family NAD(P)-dependent oxidoreductase [Cyanobium sp. Morenito 9A2]
MNWTTDDLGDLSGRLALITGANSGLGLESARALSEHGATVVLACRSRRRAEESRDALLPKAKGGLEVLELDLADLTSVAAAAQRLADTWGRLDLLLNNAGVMALPRSLTRDGLERQFGINHLGHFALTLQLLPLMEGRPGARVVTVTSGAHLFGRIAFDDLQGERRYNRWSAYAQSKLANVMFALELQQRLEAAGSGVSSLAAHPGMARTNLQPSSISANGSWIEPIAYRLMAPLFQSASMGALPQLHAAVAASARGGELYGPDQWGGARGYPARGRFAPAAHDDGARRRLWAVSEELTGVGA